jgi:hypothetical protein
MNLSRASMITAVCSVLSIIGTSHGQLTDPGKWNYWSVAGSSGDPQYISYVNFSAAQNPYQTWTSLDNGNVVKATVLELYTKTPNHCSIIETISTGTSHDTKIWTHQTNPIKEVADDPDGQGFAKFVAWGTGYQFMVAPYFATGNDSQFRLKVTVKGSITTEAACAALKPNWSYFRSGTVVRYF